MEQAARSADQPSPSTGADVLLAVSLLGVLIGLAWGVTWVHNAATAEDAVALWQGAIPPLAAALGGFLLLRVRASYGPLPRLRRFLTRTGLLGLGGAAILAAGVAWIALSG